MPIASRAQSDDVDSEAIALLRRTTDYLSSLQRFRVTTETSIEAVIKGGQNSTKRRCKP